MDKSKFKTVIVGVDFSKYSKVAVRQAFLLTKKMGAKLVIAHIYDYISFLDKDTYSSSVDSMVEYYIKKIKKAYLKDQPECEIVIKVGKPDEELLKISKKYPEPLIVVGHKGIGAFERFFLGSVAEKISLTARTPVWIHVGTTEKLPKKVLIPCDLNNSIEPLIKKISGFKMTMGSTADLFYVFNPVLPLLDYRGWVQAEEALKRQIKNKLSKVRLDFPNFLVKQTQGDPASKILKAEKNYDLVVMAPHNRKPMFPALGRVTTKVLRRSSKPILVVP